MDALYHIELSDLLWALIPVAVMGIIYIRWTQDTRTIPYALLRMILQLILIGYILTYIFTTHHSWLVAGVLTVMLSAAGIIALRPMAHTTPKLYLKAFVAIASGGLFTLAVIIFGVLGLEPWYEPRFVIPLAGMIFANAMNSVSIAAERFESEVSSGKRYTEARSDTYKAALIPIINALFAVGLVSLPGMMTGQILSGVDPLIAARYQMMVMLMVLGSAGISVAVYLKLIESRST